MPELPRFTKRVNVLNRTKIIIHFIPKFNNAGMIVVFYFLVFAYEKANQIKS